MPPQVNNNNSSKSNNISSKVRTAANTLHLHGGVQPQAEQQQQQLETTTSSGGGRSSSMNKFAIQNREEVSTRTTSAARTTAAAAKSTRIKRIIATNTSSINTNNNNNVSSSSSKKQTTTIAVAPASYKTPTYRGATSTISVSRNSTKLRGSPIVVRLADARRGEGGIRSGGAGVSGSIPNLDGNVTDEDDEDDEGDEDDPIKLPEEERARTAPTHGGAPPLLTPGPNSDPTPVSSGEASTSGVTGATAAATKATEAAVLLSCATSPPLAFPPKTASTPPRPTTPKKPGSGSGVGGGGGGRAMSHSIASLLGVDDNDDNEKEDEEDRHPTRSTGKSSTLNSSPSSATAAVEAAAALPHPVVPTSGKDSVRTHLATSPPPAPVVPSDRPLALTKKCVGDDHSAAAAEEEEDEEAMDLSGGSDKFKNEGGAVNAGSVALDLCTKRTQKESDDEKVMNVEAQTVVQNESSSIAGVSGSAAGGKDTQEQCKDDGEPVRPPDDDDGDRRYGERKESTALAADLDSNPGEVEGQSRGEASREGTSAEVDQLGREDVDVAKIKDKSEVVEVSRVEEDIRAGTNIACEENSEEDKLEPKSPTNSEAEVESGKRDEPVPESFQRQISNPAEKPADELTYIPQCKEGDDMSGLEPRTTSKPPESPTPRHEEEPEKERASAKSEGQSEEGSLAEKCLEPVAQIAPALGRGTDTTEPLCEPDHSELVQDPQPSEAADSEVIDAAQLQSDPESVDTSEFKKSDSKAEPMSESEHVALRPSPIESESLCLSELKQDDDDMPKSPLASASAPLIEPKSAGSQPADSGPEATGDHSESVESAESATMMEVKQDLKSDVDAEHEPELPQEDIPEVAENAETNDLPENTAVTTGKDDAAASLSATSTKKESGSDAEREFTSKVSESAAHVRDLLDVRVDTSEKEGLAAKAAEPPELTEPSEVTNKPCNDDDIAPEKEKQISEMDHSQSSKSSAPLDSQTPEDPQPSPLKQSQGKDDDRDGQKDDEKRVGCNESDNASQVEESETPQKALAGEETSNSPPHEEVGEKVAGEEKPDQVADDSTKVMVEHAAEQQEAAKSKEELDKGHDQLAIHDDIVKESIETSGKSVSTGEYTESTEKASTGQSVAEESMEDTGDVKSTESPSVQRDGEPKKTTIIAVPEQEKVVEKDAERVGETPSDTSKPEPSAKPVVTKPVSTEEYSESTEKASPGQSLEGSKSPLRLEPDINANAEESMEDTGDVKSTESLSTQSDGEPKKTTTIAVPEQEKVVEKDQERVGETTSDTSKPEPSSKLVVIKPVSVEECTESTEKASPGQSLQGSKSPLQLDPNINANVEEAMEDTVDKSRESLCAQSDGEPKKTTNIAVPEVEKVVEKDAERVGETPSDTSKPEPYLKLVVIKPVSAEECTESTEKASPGQSLQESKSPLQLDPNINVSTEEAIEDSGDVKSTESPSAQSDGEPKKTTNIAVPEQEKVVEKDPERVGETPSDTSKLEPSPKPVVIKLGSNYLSKKPSSETSSSSSPPSGPTISGQTVVVPSSPTPPQSQATSAAGEKTSPSAVNMSPTVRLVNIGGQVRISKTLQTDEKVKGSSPPPPPAVPDKTTVNAAIPKTAPSKICDTIAPAATPSSASPKKQSRASTVSPSPQLSSGSESEDDDEDEDDEDDDEDDEDDEEEDEDDSLSTSSSVTSKTVAPSANSTQSTSSVKSSNEILAAQRPLTPKLLTANSPSMHKTSQRLFACNVCGKECLNEGDLSLHKKRHKVDQPFVCQFCDREYVDKSR